MTISIPTSIFDIYNEGCDLLITHPNIGVDCTLFYPSKRVQCDNCIGNTMVGGSSSNVYRTGGPQPFTFGNCPLCGGQGYKEEVSSESIRMRVYTNSKDWKKVSTPIEIPDGSIQTIGFMSDLIKVRRSNKMKLDIEDDKYNNWTFELVGEPMPHGFGHNRYFVAFWKRSGDEVG